MSEYDPRGSTTTHYDLSSDDPVSDVDETPPVLSTLELLREAADAEADKIAEQEQATPIRLYSPGRAIRFTCAHIQTQKQIGNAQKLALPKQERRKAQPSMLEMDPVLVHARLIVQQTQEIALLRGETYVPIVDARSGEPLDLRSPVLLATFGTADSMAAVRKIFVKDSFLLQAGQELVEESGWNEDAADGDADDPSVTERAERRSSTG